MTLVADSVKAQTSILTLAGNVYKATGERCTAAATVAPGQVDSAALRTCMKPANAARDRVELAATKFRMAAAELLAAPSMQDVHGQLPSLRYAADELAMAFGSSGGDGEFAHAVLTDGIKKFERKADQ